MQGMFFGFVAGWWPLRHEPNVLLLHYADIKRGGAKVLRRIADFLGTRADRGAVGDRSRSTPPSSG